MAKSDGPDESWEPVWPTGTQVHCADFKLEKPATASSVSTNNERGDYDAVPIAKTQLSSVFTTS